MKYLVFRILTGGDLYVHSHMSFHDHLCHIDVAEANKPMVATAFGAKPEDVEIVGAGFVKFESMGEVKCYGYSSSLNLHSRGEADSEIIRATMLQMTTLDPNKFETAFGEYSQYRHNSRPALEFLEDREYIITANTKAPLLYGDDHGIIPAFSVVKFKGVRTYNGYAHFLVESDNEPCLLKYGGMYTLIALNDLTKVLNAPLTCYSNGFMGLDFVCRTEMYAIPEGAECSLKEILFDSIEHDPDLPTQAIGEVTLTVNGEERIIEMPLTNLCHLVHIGREKSE